VAMNLWTHAAIPTVFRHLVRGLRWLWPTDVPIPRSSAFVYRRYQLGARPLAWLFRTRCRPLATARTPGAMLFGLRLMAIDGMVENLPDTPANAEVFGYPHNGHGDGPFPQAQIVYLIECGTHAIVDAGIWPIRTHERVGGHRLLRSVDPGMLVTADRGFHSYRMVAAILARGAQLLIRLSTVVHAPVLETLADGSQLVQIRPTGAGRGRQSPIVLRRIRYQLSQPALGDPTTVHILVTSLLDPEAAPARALVCAYHERWEAEITIDELDTHQRRAFRPFRSHKPVGVVQEFYGALLAHYAIRTVMHEAAATVAVDPDRISFVLARDELCAAIHEFQQTDPQHHPQLRQRLLAACVHPLLPARRLRIYPRVLRQRRIKIPRKGPQDRGWTDPRGQFAMAICLIGADGAACAGQAPIPPIQWMRTP